MARKNYPDEFKRDAVALYRDTEGATITQIAAELGVSEATLSAWCKSAGVAIRHRRGSVETELAPGAESPEQELVRLRAENKTLRATEARLSTERDILRSAAKYFGRGDELVSRFQFVADHLHAFEVKWLCAVVEVARSSFYAWLAGADSRAAKAAADEALAARIRVVNGEDNPYGEPGITAELNDGAPDGERVNHKRVARVMRGAGIVGYRRRRRVKTTAADPASQKVPDLLKRDFTAAQINTRYVGDITYLPLATGGNLYLATVIDCCSRRVAGWAIADHMRTELVTDALNAAAALRGTLAGAVFHSDHGSQYTSRDFVSLCREYGVIQSMGAVGTSADNALAESFNAALKREILQDRACWPDAATCRREVFRWLARYNTKRRHSHCRQSSPATYERTLTPATLPEAA
ncbi:IS3 family transposase [Mycolicibacter icosiumassiliensis]|uniref:IS3 family transposase n=1 Tax=Mycolicibacter icosiumassiliensis TaxID=1792835 RepID=UPI000BDFA9E9|nr:IS3 family transposase [Mycolicibacter icosiumassiliensis]